MVLSKGVKVVYGSTHFFQQDHGELDEKSGVKLVH